MSNQLYPSLTRIRWDQGFSVKYGLCYNSVAVKVDLYAENEETGLKVRSVEIFVFY